MKKIFLNTTLLGLIYLNISHGANAQSAIDIPEAPSTVNAVYVTPSNKKVLNPTEKIDRLYNRNLQQEYILQRMTEHTYFFQSQFYGTMFYVGKKGVLLFDPVENAGGKILKAISEVTKLPITTIVYSHAHADHISSAPVILEASKKAGIKVRIISSDATAELLSRIQSKLPKPTETIPFKNGSFNFEGVNVQVHGFKYAAHTADTGVWLIPSEKVAHIPDLINADQLPYWGFAGAEVPLYFEENLKELKTLNWVFLSGGHGNVGSKADVDFYLEFLKDMKQAVGRSYGVVKWGVGAPDLQKTNSHMAQLPAYLGALGNQATEYLRPKYGQYYGFETSVPKNGEITALLMYAYQ